MQRVEEEDGRRRGVRFTLRSVPCSTSSTRPLGLQLFGNVRKPENHGKPGKEISHSMFLDRTRGHETRQKTSRERRRPASTSASTRLASRPCL